MKFFSLVMAKTILISPEGESNKSKMKWVVEHFVENAGGTIKYDYSESSGVVIMDIKDDTDIQDICVEGVNIEYDGKVSTLK